MTCLEAIELGLPIAIFEPLRGHGELNARVMERAGDAHLARTPEDLGALVRSLARREASLPAPSRDPEAPTASAVLESLAGSAPRPAPKLRSRRPRLALAGAIAVLPCFWLAFSSPGISLAAKGLHLSVPGYDPTPGKVSLAVRITDPETAAAIEGLVEGEKLPVVVFSDARGAKGLYPATGLAFGVAEEDAGGKLPSPWRDRTEAQAAAIEIQRATGEYPRYFLPSPKANLAALIEAPPRTRLVMPEEIGAGPRPGLLVVDTSGLAPGAAQRRLEQTLLEARHEGLRCVSPARL